MGGKLNQYRRIRQGMIPKTPQGLELAAKLINAGVLNDKQVARALQRQGHDFNNLAVYRLRGKMGKKPVRRSGVDKSLDRDLERGRLLKALKNFKTMDVGEQLERLEKANNALLELKEMLSKVKSPEAKKRLGIKIRQVQSRINLFSKYVPKQAQAALMEQGIIK